MPLKHNAILDLDAEVYLVVLSLSVQRGRNDTHTSECPIQETLWPSSSHIVSTHCGSKFSGKKGKSKACTREERRVFLLRWSDRSRIPTECQDVSLSSQISHMEFWVCEFFFFSPLFSAQFTVVRQLFNRRRRRRRRRRGKWRSKIRRRRRRRKALDVPNHFLNQSVTAFSGQRTRAQGCIWCSGTLLWAVQSMRKKTKKKYTKEGEREEKAIGRMWKTCASSSASATAMSGRLFDFTSVKAASGKK